MNETNIVEIVQQTSASVTKINWTLILVAAIQFAGVVLAAWTQVIVRIILKDVNSDRSQRVIEVQRLNNTIQQMGKANVVLEEQARQSNA